MAAGARAASCPSPLRYDATAPKPEAKAGSAVTGGEQGWHRFQTPVGDDVRSL